MCSDRVENSPHKRVLEILRTGQQNLMERILAMDSKEQFYYAYMIHLFSRSVIDYGGSLEQLQSSFAMHALVHLLMGISHSPDAGESVCEQTFDDDINLAAVPALSIAVLEDGITIVQSPPIAEAFQEIDSQLTLVNYAQKYFVGGLHTKTAVELLVSEKIKCEVFDGEDANLSRSIDSVFQDEDVDSVTDSVRAYTFRAGINMEVGVGEELINEALSRLKSVSVTNTNPVTDEINELSSFLCNDSGEEVNITKLKEKCKIVNVFMKSAFKLFLQKANKLLFLESRDGSKSIPLQEVDLTSQVYVRSAAENEWRSYSFSFMKAMHLVREKKMKYTFSQESFKSVEIYNRAKSFTCCMDELEDINFVTETFKFPNVIVFSPVPQPQPSPPISWCWRGRLESVTNVHDYIGSADQQALEKVDTKCHETIYHAIASTVRGDEAVSLVRTLKVKVSSTLLSAKDKLGNTPLHNAVISGDFLIVKELVSYCVSPVYIRNHELDTPLDIAVSHKNDDIVDCLMREFVRSEPHSNGSVELLQFCLVKAMKIGYIPYLKNLLKLHAEYGLAIDFECTDSEGYMAWNYLEQKAQTVKSAAVELLKETSLKDSLRSRLLKALNGDSISGEGTPADSAGLPSDSRCLQAKFEPHLDLSDIQSLCWVPEGGVMVKDCMPEPPILLPRPFETQNLRCNTVTVNQCQKDKPCSGEASISQESCTNTSDTEDVPVNPFNIVPTHKSKTNSSDGQMLTAAEFVCEAIKYAMSFQPCRDNFETGFPYLLVLPLSKFSPVTEDGADDRTVKEKSPSQQAMAVASIDKFTASRQEDLVEFTAVQDWKQLSVTLHDIFPPQYDPRRSCFNSWEFIVWHYLPPVVKTVLYYVVVYLVLTKPNIVLSKCSVVKSRQITGCTKSIHKVHKSFDLEVERANLKKPTVVNSVSATDQVKTLAPSCSDVGSQLNNTVHPTSSEELCPRGTKIHGDLISNLVQPIACPRPKEQTCSIGVDCTDEPGIELAATPVEVVAVSDLSDTQVAIDMVENIHCINKLPHAVEKPEPEHELGCASEPHPSDVDASCSNQDSENIGSTAEETDFIIKGATGKPRPVVVNVLRKLMQEHDISACELEPNLPPETTSSSSSETSDFSVLCTTGSNHRLISQECPLVKEHGEKLNKKPLIYQQPYTDSVTSSSDELSSPQKHLVSEARKQQRQHAKARIYKYRWSSTSGSDHKEHSKRRALRPQKSVQRRVKSNSFSDRESSTPSTEEHSPDSAVGDSLTGDTTVEDRQLLSSQKKLKLKSRHNCARSSSRRKCERQRKVITLAVFSSPSGEMDVKKFKMWLSSAINKHGYSHLESMVHQHLFPIFGLSPLKHRKLTRKEKISAQVVLDVVRSKKDSIPMKLVENLDLLEDILNGKQEVLVASDPNRGKKKITKGASLPRGKAPTLKSLTHSHEAQDGETDGSTKVSTTATDNSEALSYKPSASATAHMYSSTCREEESSGMSVLEFSNSCNPLDVIHSHMKVYSKCCPRHDIRNIVTVGTTYPPSDAFGPKRRYSSIKDLHSDPTHSQFDFTRKLSAQSSSNRHYRDSESQQIMFERPAPESRQNRGALPPTLLPQSSLAVVETSESHPSLPLSSKHQISQLHPSTQSMAQQTSKMSEATAITTTHRETSADTRQENPETARSSIHSRHTTSLLHSHTVPQDHKERLRSTAELLHAQDYNRILILAYEGEPPDTLPPQLKIPYIFITGLAYYKLSNHKKSVQYFTQCLRLADECRRDGDITICNIYIGDIEFAKRRYPEAAGRYKTALHHYSRDSVAQDFRMVMPTRSAVWLKCGSAFKNASRVGDSVAAYEKAIELANSKKDQLSGHTSLGNLYQGIGENGRAVKEYEAAIELAKELDDNISLGWNHGNLGNALLGLHQRDKALHHLFKALDMAVDYETTPQAIGRAYNNLGTAFQSLNELSKAEDHYDLALSQAIYGNDIPGQARVYGNIGNLQMLNKQYDRAVPHYTEVMRLSQDKATITTAHHNRGCAYYDWAEKKRSPDKQKGLTNSGVVTRSPLPDLNRGSSTDRGKRKVTRGGAIEFKGKQPTGSDSSQNSSSDEPQDKQSHFRVSLHGPDFKDCRDIFKPNPVSPAVQKYYLQGTRDLEYVIKHHEENFNGIKGSPKGLSLSVSLFETNSRTFHRMQDCLVHIQEEGKKSTRFEEALQVAEKSRARTLGELMLKRRGPQLEHELQSLPSLDQMKAIVGRQKCPVVYLSYTGERLLGWLLYPTPSSPEPASVNMFEVPLSDNEFDGKSLDYHLRYSLNEQLVEKSFEMYKPFDHEKEKTEPLEKLYDLVAQPVMMMLSTLDNKAAENAANHHQRKIHQKKENGVRKIVVIPDSYTNLLPFTCVLNKDTGKFWGDDYYFQTMPSLLTMGILNQLPEVSVTIPVQYQQMLCVVGNPSIPRFQFNNEDWDLGKLPHATKEAEWVSHILQCNPILHEQATKDAVLMRIMNAKVIHLATHGSAVAGFLAFAGMTSSSGEAVEARKVLIYPDEIESLNISPALVVLSSCDSGRGVFKADGIQGMARAFILAGAQAVLTALWRVPDESACIFMQFFYQYLVEGMRGTEALHKAILCLRCFSKYSQYIHWSGYQLTGREFQFSVSQSSSRAELATRLGTSSVFPRLDILKQLETAFLNNPRLPTDVQVCTYLIC